MIAIKKPNNTAEKKLKKFLLNNKELNILLTKIKITKNELQQ